MPQDAKSNPSNGLVERLARIVDADCFNGMRDFGGWPLRRDWALSKAREIDALYQQEIEKLEDEAWNPDERDQALKELGIWKARALSAEAANVQQEGVLSSQRGEPWLDPATLERCARAMCHELGMCADDWDEEDGKRTYRWEKETSTAAACLFAALSCPPIAPASQRGENRSANASLTPDAKSADTAALPPGPVNCTHVLRRTSKPYPRTCERCRLGPCPFYNNDGSAKR